MATPVWTRASTVAAFAALAAWAGLLGAIGSRTVFLTTDMVSNHVHVWWIADRLWHGGGLPWHMPVLASGDALTFPYGSLPWLTAAIAWPLGGDRVVTAWLVLGAVGVVAATFWALPTLRRGWWAVAVLLNPALVASVLLGQLPFLWATAFLMLAVGCWRRDRVVWATVLAAVAQVVHPAVVIPITLLLVVAALPGEAHRRRLLTCYVVSLVVALPAAVATLSSPVVAETSVAMRLYQLVTTVGMRLLVVAVPLVYEQLAKRPPSRLAPTLALVSTLLLVPMWRPFLLGQGWHAVWQPRPQAVSGFVRSPSFVRGRVYRVLAAHDGKLGLYQVVRAGGVLDSELFPESMHRKGFASDEAYAAFLTRRHVDAVVVVPAYGANFRSNEPARLEALAASRACVKGVAVRLADSARDWRVYEIDRC